MLREDYSLRFVILGSILIAAACCMRVHPRSSPLRAATRMWGLIYLFPFGLLYGTLLNPLFYHRRHSVSYTLIGISWMLGLAIAAGVALWHGMKYDDFTTRLFGFILFTTNVYVKYWDFAWNSLYRPLFFAILAGSFAMLGWGAEQMWKRSSTGRRY